ncbi:MAG: hypothetical protein LKG11_05735 [Bacilli bacterium]|jgi:hypothetical protein|nr:hypothetical protein [Bacilli bacterium]
MTEEKTMKELEGMKEEFTKEDYQLLARVLAPAVLKVINRLNTPKRERDSRVSDEERTYRRGGVISFGKRKTKLEDYKKEFAIHNPILVNERTTQPRC